MHKGMIVSTLLAALFVAPAALADRTEVDQKSSKGMQIKERVLEKQREGFRASKETTSSRAVRDPLSRADLMKPRGEVYGDQATRSSVSSPGSRATRGMSASNAVNTPSEIKKMKAMINPMAGAYRTCQAAEGTDSYGGGSMVPNGKGASRKNMSASGAVNTPKEIKAMLALLGPSAASEGGSPGSTDSYGGKSHRHAFDKAHRSKTGVHFQNERGDVTKSAAGFSDLTAKTSKARERTNAVVKSKLEKAKQ